MFAYDVLICSKYFRQKNWKGTVNERIDKDRTEHTQKTSLFFSGLDKGIIYGPQPRFHNSDSH